MLLAGIIAVVVIALVLDFDTTEYSGDVPIKNKLAEEFGCQWIVDTYRSFKDRELSTPSKLENLANEMRLKRMMKGRNIFGDIDSGDALDALSDCKDRGFQ